MGEVAGGLAIDEIAPRSPSTLDEAKLPRRASSRDELRPAKFAGFLSVGDHVPIGRGVERGDAGRRRLASALEKVPWGIQFTCNAPLRN